MSNFFSKSIDDTAQELNVSISKGLSKQEAEERVKKYGENKLEGKKERSIVMMFFEQFKDFLVIILIVAAVVSIWATGEYLEGLIIFAIVVLNSILGVTQENRANNALKALKELSNPLAKVIRDGNLEKIASNLVVPGDTVLLEAGDYIPADVRLVESVNLKVDESALTGESVPVEKQAVAVLDAEASLGDRINCAYMGTVVTYGRGRAIVTDTGMSTQMGKIAEMLSTTETETTPLQLKLNKLGKVLGIVCLAVCVLIFALGIISKMDFMEIFMVSVSLAVAAIPEGLTVVVTVVLAMGMQKMVKSNAIIKRLSAVETLGSTTVICSDKTGTLTQNKMTVVKMFDGQRLYDISGTGYATEGGFTADGGGEGKSPALERMLYGAVLCNDAELKISEEKIIGDPTEGALLVAAEKYGIVCSELREKIARQDEIPFDSDRKLMTTYHKQESGFMMFTKGAPDEILRRSRYIYKDGEVLPMSEDDKKRITSTNEAFAKNALRVLGVAFRQLNDVYKTSEQAETELVFTGLIGMIDPPREEVKTAVALCTRAGIGVKMITGDHKITASAIADQIGIVSTAEAVEGLEISAMDDQTLRERVKTTSVFARVSPEHKVRLVEAIKSNGNIVAMTGDGVNDAPSLKRADIGVAMGITGTDVSKEAADMILTDDNFASIVKAVEEGRTIYNNIRKVVGYLLSCNIGEILVIFVTMLFQLPVPLAAIQLLSINLITDAFPAFALGMEAKEEGVMDERPRDPAESIVNKKMFVAVAMQSCALAIGTLSSFIYGLYRFCGGPNGENIVIASTMCYFTLVMGELLRAYGARSENKSLFKMKVFGNNFLNNSVIVSIFFLWATIYVGFLQKVFTTTALNIEQLLTAFLFAFIPLIVAELSKIVTKNIK